MRLRYKVLLGIAAVVVAAGATLPLWVDRAARSAVESGATGALGVPTTLGGIDVSLFGGTCTMDALRVGNPAGFDEPFFLKMRSGNIAVTLGSLLEDTVVVPELVLEDLDVRLERHGLKTNYGAILDALEKSGEGAAPGRKYVIETIRIRNVRVKARLSIAGVARPAVSATIPEIRLSGVGSESGGGVVLRQVVGQVMTGVLAGVLQSGVLPDEIAEGLGAGLRGLGTAAGLGLEVVGEGGRILGKGVREAGEGVGKVVEGIGGLLGGDGGKDGDGKKEDDR